MKRKTKFLSAILIVFILAVSLTPLAFASEGDEAAVADDASGITEDSGTLTGNREEGENAFSMLFDAIKAHSAEILSALTLVGSVILAYCYKRGLTPMLTKALGTMGSAISSIKESAGRAEEKSAQLTDALTGRLDAAERVISGLAENITTLTESLARSEELAGKSADMRVVLAAQVDMLYDIFMTSNLPQYQKDAVGERISAMRGVLGINDN